ncbi:hypothetical protein D3C80_1067020 [compost metagenome]
MGGQGLGDIAAFGLNRQIAEAAAGCDDDGGAGRRAGRGSEDLQRRSGHVPNDVEAAARKRADNLDLRRRLGTRRGAGPDVERLGGGWKGESSRNGDQKAEARERGGHGEQTSRTGGEGRVLILSA